jgi:hypothetical protein
MFAIRVLFKPEAHSIESGLAVLGGTLGFTGLGKAPSLAKRDVPQAATLRFHGAYLTSARGVPPAPSPFAEIRGEVRRRRDGSVVFTLPADVEIQYVTPVPDDPPPTQLNLQYEATSFENAPARGSSALSLKLPVRPEGARYFELVAQLEIQGSEEAATTTNAVLDVPLQPLSFFKARLVDKDDAPLSGLPFELELPDGTVVRGETDGDGVGLINPVMRGECVLRLDV